MVQVDDQQGRGTALPALDEASMRSSKPARLSRPVSASWLADHSS
jgi:hypothetical protein